MSVELMDIELLAQPMLTAESGWLAWTLAICGLVIVLALIWFMRGFLHQPRMKIWRWQRALRKGKDVRELALNVYDGLQQTSATRSSKHTITLTQQQVNLLHQACFASEPVSAAAFNDWLAQLKPFNKRVERT